MKLNTTNSLDVEISLFQIVFSRAVSSLYLVAEHVYQLISFDSLYKKGAQSFPLATVPPHYPQGYKGYKSTMVEKKVTYPP